MLKRTEKNKKLTPYLLSANFFSQKTSVIEFFFQKSGKNFQNFRVFLCFTIKRLEIRTKVAKMPHDCGPIRMPHGGGGEKR